MKKVAWSIVGAGLLMLAANTETGKKGLYMVGVKPPGLRNNNAGNIRKSGDAWKGLATNQSDPSFFVFEAPEWGVRAIAKLLQTYQKKYGYSTIRQFINRYAPPSENLTDAYIIHVADVARVSPDQSVDVVNNAQVRQLIVDGIIKHENGFNPYSDAEMYAWTRLA